ncbi:hypothetical protein SUGI_1079590 [Cryptomeria japonica]|nr:hypothetical protein SUGI_1079590 [Cryptomeria japonica]
MEFSGSRKEKGVVCTTVLQGLPSAVVVVVIEPFTNEAFGGILYLSQGGGRSQGSLSKPTIFPEEDVPAISNDPWVAQFAPVKENSI